MYERFTDRARKVAALAHRAALEFGGDSLSDVDLLIGICREGSGIAIQALKQLGVDVQSLQRRLEEETRRGAPLPGRMTRRLHTASAKRVVESAVEIARELNHDHIGTGHFLLAVLNHPTTSGAKSLESAGVTALAARDTVIALTQAAVVHPST